MLAPVVPMTVPMFVLMTRGISAPVVPIRFPSKHGDSSHSLRRTWGAAPLVRIDPGVLVRNDPPLSGMVVGDGRYRRAEETSLLEVSALVSS